MKVVDTERVVILMRFIQYGWDEERRKAFDDNLRMMLETQCEDLAEHDKRIKDSVIDEIIKYFEEHHILVFDKNEIVDELEQLKENK